MPSKELYLIIGSTLVSFHSWVYSLWISMNSQNKKEETGKQIFGQYSFLIGCKVVTFMKPLTGEKLRHTSASFVYTKLTFFRFRGSHLWSSLISDVSEYFTIIRCRQFPGNCGNRCFSRSAEGDVIIPTSEVFVHV